MEVDDLRSRERKRREIEREVAERRRKLYLVAVPTMTLFNAIKMLIPCIAAYLGKLLLPIESFHPLHTTEL